MGPGIAPVYAEDVAVRARFAYLDNAAARATPLKDKRPVCEGECAPYSGDLTIRVVAPLTACMPDDAKVANDEAVVDDAEFANDEAVVNDPEFANDQVVGDGE